ncbi:MAG: hypothetical protein QOD10_1341, partial [Mycobacterium sp.]|nr:hypothetical protein [Mycobacterium sp.]
EDLPEVVVRDFGDFSGGHRQTLLFGSGRSAGPGTPARILYEI